MCLGKQGERQLKHLGLKTAYSNNEIFDLLTFENVSEFTSKIMKTFVDGKYDRIDIVYNEFKNAAVHLQIAGQFLPIEPIEKEAVQNTNLDFIYEPSKEYIIQELIPKSLKIQFYKALLDSHAAEHGARMTAMHQATDNATEMLNELTLQYNITIPG